MRVIAKVPANASDASGMIAAATSIMKQLGDNSPPVVADFPPADGSNSTFGQEYVEGEGHKQD